MTTIKLKSHGKVDLSNYNVGSRASGLLPKVTFTDGVEYEIVIIKGEEFSDDKRTTKNIHAEAKKRGYLIPPAEVTLLLREKLSDKDIEEMGLWGLVTMHEPIKDSGGGPRLLGASRRGDGRWLRADWDGPGGRWGRGSGFAFLSPTHLTARSLRWWRSIFIVIARKIMTFKTMMVI